MSSDLEGGFASLQLEEDCDLSGPEAGEESQVLRHKKNHIRPEAGFSGKIPIARTLALPVFAHGNEHLKDFLDRNRVNTGFHGLLEDRFEHFCRPLLIVDGYPFLNLDPGNLPGKFLPFCNEPDYPGIHL
jgi:hypothetical protein